MSVMNFATVPTANLVRLKRRLEKFTALVAAELGCTVRMRVPSSYDAVLDGMLLDDWDLVVAGTELWVTAIDRGAKYRPLVRPVREGQNAYRAAIFVRRESGIHRLDQLARRRMVFVSRSSTAGFVVPRAAMSRAGVSLQSLGSHSFAGSHENVLNLVHSGRAEAGASFIGAVESLVADNPAIAQELEPVWTSDPIPNEVYALSEAFCERHPDAHTKLQAFITGMHTNERGRSALDAMNDRVDKFEAVELATYDAARPMLRRS